MKNNLNLIQGSKHKPLKTEFIINFNINYSRHKTTVNKLIL